MVDQLSANYLYRRNNVFYFTKRVPKDLSNFYVTNRIVISLKTKSNVSAMRASKVALNIEIGPATKSLVLTL